MMMMQPKSGLSLAEVVIALGVISVLLGLMFSSILGGSSGTSTSLTEAKVGTASQDVASAIRLAYAKHGNFDPDNASLIPTKIITDNLKLQDKQTVDTPLGAGTPFGTGTLSAKTLSGVQIYVPSAWDTTKNYSPAGSAEHKGFMVQLEVDNKIYCLAIPDNGVNTSYSSSDTNCTTTSLPALSAAAEPVPVVTPP